MTTQKIRRLVNGVLVFFAASLVAVLSFISLEVAFGIFCLSSLGFAAMFERNRRSFWEQAADFKFQKLDKKHAALRKEVMRLVDRLSTVENQTKANSIANTAQTQSESASVSYKDIVSKSANDRSGSRQLSIQEKLSQARKQYSARQDKLLNAANQTRKDMTAQKKARYTVLEDHSALSDMVVEELLGHALRSKRLDMFLQPIVRLPQRQHRFYEVFSRVRAKKGVYLPAARYLKLARKNDTIQDIDTLLLSECLGLIAEQPKDDKSLYFINITERTLKNGVFMSRFLAYLSKNRDIAKNIVFEMRQSEFHDMPIPVLKIIAGLSKLGCSFSLDQVTKIDEDLADLQRFNVRYLKVHSSIFTTTIGNDRAYKALMKSKRMLEGNGIGVIVTNIEDEKTLIGLHDFSLHYGQGYLFGRPEMADNYTDGSIAKAG